MAEAEKVNYRDILKEEGREVAYGGSIYVFLEYYDSRFKNLTALDIEGDEDFRKNCSVYFVYDLENCENTRLGENIVYTNIDGNDIVIGKLSEDERKSLIYWLLEYGLDAILEAKSLDELDRDSFNSTYLPLTEKI